MDTEIVLPYVQQPATCPYYEPDSSTPIPRSYFLNIHLILYSHLRLAIPSSFFPSCLLTKSLYAPLFFPYVPHAPSVSFFLICCPEHNLVRNAKRNAP